MRHSFNLERFDLIVWSAMLALGLMTGLVLLRGDQVGVRVSDLVPAPDSTGVSTRTTIRLTFGEQMDQASVERRFQVTPPLTGTLSWRGKTLIWRPGESLAAEARYVVTLAAGARSTQGRHLQDDLVWTFRTGQPSILFMSAGDLSQLYAIETTALSARYQLTHFEDGSSVWDYAASPDGSRIAFSVVRPDGSAVDLWLMNADGSDSHLLLQCEQVQCSGLAWSPDASRLAYERRELNVELGSLSVGPGPPRVWLLDLHSGRTMPLSQDDQLLGYAPRWSPDGSCLAYFEPQRGVRVLDLDTQTSQLIPNQLGEMGTWSPDGQALVLVDFAFTGQEFASYLVRADLNDGRTRDLSPTESQAADGSPAWSPTGEWIAFGRKALADGTPTPGQQLWLMRPDGSEAHPLVTDSEAHLGGIKWSPDGSRLAYQRFQLLQAGVRPEIWLVSLDGGHAIKLAANGALPSWLP